MSVGLPTSRRSPLLTGGVLDAFLAGDITTGLAPGDVARLVALLTRQFTPADQMSPNVVLVNADGARQAFDRNPNRIACGIIIPENTGNVWMGSSPRIKAGTSSSGAKGFLIPAANNALTWLFGPEYIGPVHIILETAKTNPVAISTLELSTMGAS